MRQAGVEPSRQFIGYIGYIGSKSGFRSLLVATQPEGALSTAGVRPDPPWLYPLLARGYQISCGFDTDEPGETASRQMITRHPSIQRLRPPGHDWNNALTAPSK